MGRISARIIFKVLEYLILIGLSFVAIYLSMGAFAKYQSMATNLALSFEEVKEHPTMTICFNPTHDEFVYGQNFDFNFYEKLHDFYEDKASNTKVFKG